MLGPAALALRMERMQHRRNAPVLHPLHRLLRGEAAQWRDKEGDGAEKQTIVPVAFATDTLSGKGV